MPLPTFDHAKLAEFCRRRGIVELAVFGSVARDSETRDSDLDILARFAPGVAYDVDDRDEMVAELTRLLGRRVDLVPLHAVRIPYILNDIQRTKRVVYAA